MMVKIPEGVTVWVKGKCFKGEVPEEFCPEKFKMTAPKKLKKTEVKKDDKDK